MGCSLTVGERTGAAVKSDLPRASVELLEHVLAAARRQCPRAKLGSGLLTDVLNNEEVAGGSRCR